MDILRDLWQLVDALMCNGAYNKISSTILGLTMRSDPRLAFHYIYIEIICIPLPYTRPTLRVCLRHTDDDTMLTKRLYLLDYQEYLYYHYHWLSLRQP